MQPIIMESPFAEDDKKTAKRNLEYARAALLDCLQRGEAPFASHLLYTQVLDDTDPAQRTQGIEAGFAWWFGSKNAAEEPMIVFYVDHGMTSGMVAALERATKIGACIQVRRILNGGAR